MQLGIVFIKKNPLNQKIFSNINPFSAEKKHLTENSKVDSSKYNRHNGFSNYMTFIKNEDY